MNSWANVGDLVFVLGRENEIVPCKVTKKIGTGPNIQLFFEPIEDKDKRKVPKNRLKCFITHVGWNGGFVFKKRQNAVDYLDAVMNGDNVNIPSMISKKTKRVQQNLIKQNNNVNIQKIKDEATQDAVNKVHKIVIAAMLVALNKELGIGPKRGAQVVEEINHLIEEVGEGKISQEDLFLLAESKMKIKIGGNDEH